MDSRRFDALTRRLGAAGSRRQVLSALVAAALGQVFQSSRADEVAAVCSAFDATCNSSSPCCPNEGLRCRKHRCRCEKGRKHCPGAGTGCQDLKTDPDNCGDCGNQCPPETPCCIDGKCQELCDGECCADCFVEILLNGMPDLDHPVCCPGSGGTICGPNKKKESDDRCCYPDQECLKGQCCCDGCEGSVVCGGKCCAIEACCNGKCCDNGKVCATTENGDACVSANRACSAGSDCHGSEVCHDGVCCSGLRRCNDGTNNFCCDADEYCQFNGIPIAECCPINTGCGSTYRGRRVRR